MTNEVQEPEPGAGVPAVASKGHSGPPSSEDDPRTCYGLLWRIVRTAVESNGNLIRVCILITLLIVLIAVARNIA
jgi:hypothetical protein